jgi:hypothetical protein
MRFGDSRVQALAGALCASLCAVTGITNNSLRALMTGLTSTPYSMTQASCDLARLRRNGLITRRPHANTYDLTADSLAFAIFCTKVHDRVLARYSPPVSRTHRPNSATPCASSTSTSTPADLSEAASGSLTNSAQLSESPIQRIAKGSLRSVRDFARKEWPPSGAVRLT